MRKKLAYLIKHNSAVQFLYRNIMSTLFRFVGLFVKTDNTLVLLNSYGGEQYSDSPRVLYEKMLVDERFLQYHFVWAFESPKKFDESNCPSVHNIRTSLVMIDSPAYFITALKAKIWITNVNIERGLSFKKKETIYLNTWHGTGPKKSGNAIKTRNDFDFSNVDIFCCDGEYSKNAHIKYFKVSEASILMCGRPREDELFTFVDKDKERLRIELGIPERKKAILFMPTWRDYEHSLPDFSLWQRELEEEYIVLYRAHHFERTAQLKDKYRGFIIDVTDYDNINELYYVSDILISDYSSAFFDFGLLGKPMLCFAEDYERYCETTGLFIDLENEFPNGVIKSENTLLSTIRLLDYELAGKETRNFINKYVSRKGNATASCLDRMAELIDRID